MTNHLITQLVATYDQNPRLGVNDVARIFDLEPSAAKLALVSGGSKRYVEEGAAVVGSKKKFREAIVERAIATMEDLLEAEDPNIRFKAGEFILKVDIGAIGKAETTVNNFVQNNLHIINDQLRRGLEAREAARNRSVSGSVCNDVHNRRGLPEPATDGIPLASEGTRAVCEPLPEGDFIPA